MKSIICLFMLFASVVAHGADQFYEVAISVPNAAPAKPTTSAFYYDMPTGTPDVAIGTATLGDGSGASAPYVKCGVKNLVFMAFFAAGDDLPTYPSTMPTHVWCPIGSAGGTNHHVKVVLVKETIDYTWAWASDTITAKTGTYHMVAFELPAGATYPNGKYACKKGGVPWTGANVQVVSAQTGTKKFAWVAFGVSASAGTGTCAIPRTGLADLVIDRVLVRN